VDGTGIRPAIVTGAHYLAFHVKVAREKEDLLDSGVVVAWNVSASIHADQQSIVLAGFVFKKRLQENARGDGSPREFFRTGNQDSILFQNDSRDSGTIANF